MWDLYISSHPVSMAHRLMTGQNEQFNSVVDNVRDYGALTSIAMSFASLNDFFSGIGNFFRGVFDGIGNFFRSVSENWQIVAFGGVALVVAMSLLRK